ncbi:MAG: helix-turn-helix transcriptional regulator [Acidobacteriota bacterium]
MIRLLDEIHEAAARLEESADLDRPMPMAGSIGLYRCWRPQEIRDIVMPDAAVLLVLKGHKKLATASQSWTAAPGEILLIPAGTQFWLGNYPDETGQRYRGMAIRFSSEVIEHFRQVYGAHIESESQAGHWHATAPHPFLHAVHQWLAWCGQHAPSEIVARHRLVELLLLLTQHGLASHLLLPYHPSWSRRVTALVHLDPAHTWRMEEVGARLGVSESTLRRHLQDEGTGFRGLLEEVRLIQGLTLVQESIWPIGRIADAVGYRSQSRFSERFKRRFGLTPRALRHTQDPPPAMARINFLSESGERLAD